MQNMYWYTLFMQAWGMLDLNSTLRYVCPDKRSGESLDNLLARLLQVHTVYGSLHNLNEHANTIPLNKEKVSAPVLYSILRRKDIDYDKLLMSSARQYIRYFFDHQAQWFLTISEIVVVRSRSLHSEGISHVFAHNLNQEVLGFKYVLISITDGCLTVPLKFRLVLGRNQNKDQKLLQAPLGSFGEKIRLDAQKSQEMLTSQLISEVRQKIYRDFQHSIYGVISDQSLNINCSDFIQFCKRHRLHVLFPILPTNQRFNILQSELLPTDKPLSLKRCTQHLLKHHLSLVDNDSFTASALVQNVNGKKQQHQLVFALLPNFMRMNMQAPKASQILYKDADVALASDLSEDLSTFALKKDSMLQVNTMLNSVSKLQYFENQCPTDAVFVADETLDHFVANNSEASISDASISNANNFDANNFDFVQPKPELMALFHNFKQHSPQHLLHIFHSYKGTAVLADKLRTQYASGSGYFSSVFDSAHASFCLANLAILLHCTISRLEKARLKAPKED